MDLIITENYLNFLVDLFWKKIIASYKLFELLLKNYKKNLFQSFLCFLTIMRLNDNTKKLSSNIYVEKEYKYQQPKVIYCAIECWHKMGDGYL